VWRGPAYKTPIRLKNYSYRKKMRGIRNNSYLGKS
jgi:hypothetical protein